MTKRVAGRVDDNGHVTREYQAYANAKARCNNPNHWAWRWYGARGIKFVFTSFAQFLNEVGFCPTGQVLDRRDNSAGYQPGNVRWVTRKESARNRRPQINKHGLRLGEI